MVGLEHPQHAEPLLDAIVLAGDAQPDIERDALLGIAAVDVTRERDRPLRQNLEDGFALLFHPVEDEIAELVGNVFVHQVGHAVDEDPAHPEFAGFVLDGPEALCVVQTLGVRADFREGAPLPEALSQGLGKTVRTAR